MVYMKQFHAAVKISGLGLVFQHCVVAKPFLLHLHFFPVDARAEVKRYSSLLASPPAYISE